MVNYWLDKGIAGFRVDAICNLKKNITCGRLPVDGEDGLCDIRHGILNQPGLDQFLRELKERTFQIHNSMTVAEAVIPYEFLGEFIGEDGFFSMVFDFSYTDIDIPPSGEWFPREKWTVKDLRDKIFHSQEMLQKTGWGAPYLENHDQPRSINKYIPEKEISYYSKTMLAGLFLMLKGTPFIYQGQEIGMENIRMDRIEEYDDVSTFTPYERAIASGMSKEEAMEVVFARSRDNARTPMQWDDTKNAGFSQHDTTWLKVNPNYREINTKNNKVLEFYKRLISLRRNSEYRETVIYGEFVPVRDIDEPVIVYERVSGENKLMTICNFQNAPAEVQIKEGYKEVVISNYENRPFKTGWITLKPYECVILSGV